MKHCNKCDKDKDIKDFAKRTFKTKVGHSSWCKECSNSNRMKTYKNDFVREAAVRKELRHKYRKENITKAHKYLSEQGCKDCGEKDPIVLDFDHHKDKKYNLSDKFSCTPWDTLLKEIEKCDVRCSNCHRRKTAKDFGWYG